MKFRISTSDFKITTYYYYLDHKYFIIYLGAKLHLYDDLPI